MTAPPGTLRWPKFGPRNDDEFDSSNTHVLGTGGQATVVSVLQRGLKRQVAVKIPLAHPSGPDLFDQLITQEAAALAAIDHPDIVGLHAVALNQDGRPTLAMERIEGAPWIELLSEPGHPMWVAHGEAPAHNDAPRSTRLEAHIRILMRVCSAVQHVNDADIIHGDLKPANVIVGPLGRATLLDFGIARIASEDTAPQAQRGVEGTAAFMAPEIANGAPPNKVARDVFTLGAILHVILTGKGPYERRSPFSTLVACASGDREPNYPPGTPSTLSDICERAIAFDPTERYASAGALRLALDNFLRRRTASALLEDAIQRVQLWRLETAGVMPIAESAQVRDTVRRPEGATDGPSASSTGSLPDALEAAWSGYQECVMRLEAVRSLWSDNKDAERWARTATTAMAEIALDHNNLDLADQLIVQLEDPEALRQRFQTLAQARAKDKEALAKIGTLVKDADVSQGWKARRMMISAIAVAVGLTMFINGELLRMEWASFGLRDVQWSGLIWFALTVIGAWRSWDAIAPNQAARRQVHALLVLVSVGAIHWPLCYQLGLTLNQSLDIMMFWIGICGYMASFSLFEPRFATASLAVLAHLAASILIPGWSFHFAGLALWVAAALIMRPDHSSAN